MLLGGPDTHRALYAAFDRYPSPKGAAIHIRHMAGELFDTMGGGVLYVVGDEDLPGYQREGSVEILRYQHATPGEGLLRRALGFRDRLAGLLDQAGRGLQICHFRDPWGGVAIVTHPGRRYRTVYEINGLPSIELPHAYPGLAARTLDKIRQEERLCWSLADAIVTPGRAMRDNLIALGVPAGKIRVIPNGADPTPEAGAGGPGAPSPPGRYLLYFGALQSWQGIDVLLRAFALLADLPDLGLVICSATRERHARPYQRLAARLGVADRVTWRFRLSRAELRPVCAGATLSLAPLTECPRNLEQGCCPLKILESMAAGVPVVASDLPAVRDLITDGVDGRLVRPGRPPELARAVRVLLEYPERLGEMGAAARRRIAADFTWAGARQKLHELYDGLRRPDAPVPLEAQP